MVSRMTDKLRRGLVRASLLPIRLSLALGLAACALSAAPLPAVEPVIASVDDAGAVPVNDAGADAAALARISTLHGCGGPASADRAAIPASSCAVRGSHAFVFGIVVPLGDGTFIEVGLYGGGAAVEAPTVADARTRITVTEPLHIEGIVVFDRMHLALTHAQGGLVHPTLKLAPGAPLMGVARGDRFVARAPFGWGFSVGPLDLACSAVGLGDDNEFETIAPKPDRNLLVAPRKGAYHAEWQEPPLVKASPDASDGLRLASFDGAGSINDATFAVLERRSGYLKIHARTVAGSELTGWTKASDLPPAKGGRGEGIGLCGCGHRGRLPESPVRTLASGAKIHARPDGPVWPTVPAPLQATLAADGSDERSDRRDWRKIVGIDRVSEGGDACSSERFEHAWVRASDLR